jgi:AcrR family transcriptional regulator
VSEELGLRERKRREAMRRIQAVALDLFDAHGFGAVTIERIARAAEVSPSSVYRYFQTKEGIVLYDENEAAIELADIEPAEAPLETFRLAAMASLAHRGENPIDRRRVRYLMEVPSIQAAVTRRIFGDPPPLAGRVAQRLDGEIDDLNVMVTWSALFGAVLGAIRYWHEHDYAEPLSDLLDRAFDALRELD